MAALRATMPLALNLTAPLKQDPDSQRKIAAFAAAFTDYVQPRMDHALAESELVHFARVLLIGEPPRYLQILTEYDGEPLFYTEFFRTKLGDLFKDVFALIEGAPPWEEIDDETSFHHYAQSLNLPALGKSVRPDVNRGYLFSAYGDLRVDEIKPAMGL
jgi:hypothetical protein